MFFSEDAIVRILPGCRRLDDFQHISNQPVVVGVPTPCEAVSTRKAIVLTSGLLELYVWEDF